MINLIILLFKTRKYKICVDVPKLLTSTNAYAQHKSL
jgi:hypothetical protein